MFKNTHGTSSSFFLASWKALFLLSSVLLERRQPKDRRKQGKKASTCGCFDLVSSAAMIKRKGTQEEDME